MLYVKPGLFARGFLSMFGRFLNWVSGFSSPRRDSCMECYVVARCYTYLTSVPPLDTMRQTFLFLVQTSRVSRVCLLCVCNPIDQS